MQHLRNRTSLKYALNLGQLHLPWVPKGQEASEKVYLPAHVSGHTNPLASSLPGQKGHSDVPGFWVVDVSELYSVVVSACTVVGSNVVGGVGFVDAVTEELGGFCVVEGLVAGFEVELEVGRSVGVSVTVIVVDSVVGSVGSMVD